MMRMAEAQGWVTRLTCKEGGSAISIVQYVDGTIILSEAEELSVRGIKFVCKCFELVLGLRINFRKSLISGINVEETVVNRMAGILGCQTTGFPLRHLGLPLSLGRFPKTEWMPLISRFEKRLAGWKSNFLSLRGKIILIQSVLLNLSIYFLSLFSVLKGILRTMEGIRRRFLWNGAKGDSRRVYLVKWDKVCMGRMEGGTGILNMADMNKALLLKWLWRWLDNPFVMWGDLAQKDITAGCMGGLISLAMTTVYQGFGRVLWAALRTLCKLLDGRLGRERGYASGLIYGSGTDLYVKDTQRSSELQWKQRPQRLSF
ncbi:hypothetical protein QJS10_CPB13g01578 [Acorus calamus]|uniref:Uncharacterized protein n=1 Tax=Acorus calamus TaxID=4465 RepID=A0AAV9DH09_ACOCL|nr:hypothetical protein QJS10_CPB13g01578 [Acorus calamus]